MKIAVEESFYRHENVSLTLFARLPTKPRLAFSNNNKQSSSVYSFAA
jgi:hypothetical protein